MENKAPSLWDGKSEAPKGLRPPNTPRNVLFKDETKTISSTPSASREPLHVAPENDRKFVSSRLSAEAPEFYPSYYHSPAPVTNKSSVQSRLNKHKDVQATSTQQPQTGELGADFVGSTDDLRLKNIIDTLTKDPGQFANLVDLFMATLGPYLGDILVVSRTAQLLLDQAIDHPSFRYSAARLCCYIEQNCPTFRAEVHLNCQKKMSVEHTNKSGLILFVAELYTQLHFENIYGLYLINAYKHLLTIGGNEIIKSICQALKLTGYSLEQFNKKALDEVFIKLNEVKPSVTGTALSLINSVINLRSSQWGHDSPTNSNATGAESEQGYWNEHASTVFCEAADGMTFTSEENDFLAANMNSAEDYLTDVSDPDELCDPEPEMDEEIRVAFRDFVKLSKR